MLSRRFFLGGLLAAPAVVAIGNLMPLVGVKYDPFIRVQSWPIGSPKYGAWWLHESRLSKLVKVEGTMKEMFGSAHWEIFEPTSAGWPIDTVSGTETWHSYADEHCNEFLRTLIYKNDHEVSSMGVRPSKEEFDEHHRLSSPGAPSRVKPLQRASYKGCVIRLDRDIEEQRLDIDRAWGRHIKDTAALIERKRQLHTLGHPDANRILREAGYVI